MALPSEPDWVFTFEAGDAVGKSDQTIVAWIDEGEFEPDEFRRSGRRYQVSLEAVLRVAATKPPPRGTRKRRQAQLGALLGASGDDDSDRLRLALKEAEHERAQLADERDRLREENARLRDTAADLHRALARWIGVE
jgi:hypothetical protein